MDYLQLLNALGKHVKPGANAFHPAQALGTSLVDTGLDSLDTTILAVYVCEIFGIPEEVGKNLAPGSFADIAAFVEKHATRTPSSVEGALSVVRG